MKDWLIQETNKPYFVLVETSLEAVTGKGVDKNHKVNHMKRHQILLQYCFCHPRNKRLSNGRMNQIQATTTRDLSCFLSWRHKMQESMTPLPIVTVVSNFIAKTCKDLSVFWKFCFPENIYLQFKTDYYCPCLIPFSLLITVWRWKDEQNFLNFWSQLMLLWALFRFKSLSNFCEDICEERLHERRRSF